MSSELQNDQMQAYTEAVKSGLYAKKSGLVGKYDNVRRYWEDEITRLHVAPALQKIIELARQRMARVRILDLGCGSADGYELLMGIQERDADLRKDQINLLPSSLLGIYKGIDLNEDLLEQARSIYGENPKMIFEQADFSKGLPLEKDEKPYDLYFTSYGTCSHFNDDEPVIRLLVDIAKRTKDYSVVVCDWLGRYSYEWQTLWTNDLSENRNMDYVVSYIYEKAEREIRRAELQHLLLRLMSRQEVEDIIQKASKEAGVEIRPMVIFDRSVLTGRHMDTGEYNPHAQPLRKAINSLHEANMRTDLGSLLFNYVPRQGFDFVNEFFEHLQMCWNTLLEYTAKLLDSYNDRDACYHTEPDPIPASYPKPLREMMDRMRRVVEGVGWLGTGLPRENIIEPQLGYALRYLLTNLQQGQGCAHGLVVVLEVDKSR